MFTKIGKKFINPKNSSETSWSRSSKVDDKPKEQKLKSGISAKNEGG